MLANAKSPPLDLLCIIIDKISCVCPTCLLFHMGYLLKASQQWKKENTLNIPILQMRPPREVEKQVHAANKEESQDFHWVPLPMQLAPWLVTTPQDFTCLSQGASQCSPRPKCPTVVGIPKEDLRWVMKCPRAPQQSHVPGARSSGALSSTQRTWHPWSPTGGLSALPVTICLIDI